MEAQKAPQPTPERIGKRILRFLARRFANFVLVNNAAYWDRYVLMWRLSGKGKKYRYLGEEWKGEEIFLQILNKYSEGRETALEIGCGGGKITAKAHGLFKTLHATDISKRMLKEARSALGNQDWIRFSRSDGFTLKQFQDSSIDLVFSHDVFVHFSALQVYTYLLEIRRVVRPSGIAIISFYDYFKHFGLFKEMAARYASFGQLPPHMRVHFITEQVLRHMASQIGFKPLEIDLTNFLVAVFEVQE